METRMLAAMQADSAACCMQAGCAKDGWPQAGRPYLQVGATANDGILDMAAFFNDHIIHDNGANNLDAVAQLARGTNDRSLYAAPVSQNTALADNTASRHCCLAA